MPVQQQEAVVRCTVCRSRPANRMLIGVLVCRQCKQEAERAARLERLRSAPVDTSDPACTCGHAFSEHPPSPLYSCAAPGCDCGVYLRDWKRSEVQQAPRKESHE